MIHFFFWFFGKTKMFENILKKLCKPTSCFSKAWMSEFLRKRLIHQKSAILFKKTYFWLSRDKKIEYKGVKNCKKGSRGDCNPLNVGYVTALLPHICITVFT